MRHRCPARCRSTGGYTAPAARHTAMELPRRPGSRPLTAIGKLLGGRDHATVLHACRRIAREHAALPQTRDDVDTLESALSDRSVS